MNKHIAKLPDGSVATRNSQSRVYPYCVAERDSYERAVSNALEQADRPYVRSDYDWAVRETGPNPKWAGSHSPVRMENMQATAAMSFEDYAAKVVADTLAKVEKLKAKGYYEQWRVAGWNGRRDLAEKLVAQRRGLDHVAEARVIETNFAGEV